MSADAGILLGIGDSRVTLNPRYANRHGLIAGATGTGKTVSLQVLAQGFSDIGVPVMRVCCCLTSMICEPRYSISVTMDECADIMRNSPFAGRYDKAIDCESAHELLQKRAEKIADEAEQQAEQKEKQKAEKGGTRRSNRQGVGEALVKSITRSIGSALGRRMARGILGSLFKGR